MNKSALKQSMSRGLQLATLLSIMLFTASMTTVSAQAIELATTKINTNPTLGSTSIVASQVAGLPVGDVAKRVAIAGKAIGSQNGGSTSTQLARKIQSEYYLKFASSLFNGSSILQAFNSQIGELREVIPQTSGLPSSFTHQFVEQELVALIMQ